MGCSNPSQKKIDPAPPSIFNTTINFSSDSLTATITSDKNLLKIEKLTLEALKIPSALHLTNLIYSELSDSLKKLYVPIVKDLISSNNYKRNYYGITNKEDKIIFNFFLDTTIVFNKIRTKLIYYNPSSPISPLFDKDGLAPDFNKIRPSSPIILPINGILIPSKASRLPNALRDYRSGIHRGIDFFSNWGTEVKSVDDGIIIRSDRFYQEISPQFRVDMLKRASALNRTPSDIFNELLLGQAVIIDHGFSLFNGYRSITIYAHLSHINSDIKPGYNIKRGEVFGRSGNTGTRPSTLGTRNESHLHWELILQDSKGEYYFGQNLDHESLKKALAQLFNY